MAGKAKKPRRYAAGTTVGADKTRADIERMLVQHGASSFVHAWDGDRDVSVLIFRMHNRMLRYHVWYPAVSDLQGPRTSWAASRGELLKKRQEAEFRRRWRALHLILKAKLELVASGDAEFDKEFLCDILLPDQSTVADYILPQIEQVYETGSMPKLLPGLPAPKR